MSNAASTEIEARPRIDINIGARGRGVPIDESELGGFEMGSSQFGGGTTYIAGTQRIVINNEE